MIHFVISLSLSFSSILIVSLFWGEPLLTFILLGALSLAFLYFKSSKQQAVLYLICALLGPTCEAIAIHFGAWQYTNPQFLGIPIWLPFLWGLAGLTIIEAYKSVTENIKD